MSTPTCAPHCACRRSKPARENPERSSWLDMKLPPLDPALYRDIVRRALDEDLGGKSDITTDSTVPAAQRGRGEFRVNGDCVIAGLDVAFECFRALQPDAQMVKLKDDGVKVAAGTLIAS